MRTSMTLVALGLLVLGVAAPAPVPAEPRALVWESARGVHGVAGRHVRSFGGDAAGGFAWTDRFAFGVVAGDLVRWEPKTGVLRRVPCADCAGAAVVGDEVRTVDRTGVRRFASADLADLGAIAFGSDVPAEVVAATADLTVVRRGDAVLGVEDSGAVRWEYAGAIGHPAVHPNGEEMAFSEVVGSADLAEHSAVTVLELVTGRPKILSRPSSPCNGATVVSDLWWNGTSLVAALTNTSCSLSGEHEVSDLTRGTWGGGWVPADDVAFRALPSGDVVRLSATGVLKSDGATVASGVTRLWSPPGRDWVQLPGDRSPGR